MATFSSQHPELLATEVREVIFQRFSMKPQQYQDILDVRQSTKADERMQRVQGMPTLSIKEEGEPMAYRDPLSGPLVLSSHTVYGEGFRITKEMRTDDQQSVMNQMSTDLGDAARNHQETIAATLPNDAFAGAAFTSIDGVAPISTAHTTLGGVVQSNRLNPDVDLSVTGLEDMLTLVSTTLTEEGRQANITSDMVLVPPELQHQVKKLLKSEFEPFTSDNQISVVKSTETGQRPVVWNFLTDPDAWFVRAPAGEHHWIWFDRETLENDSNMDAQTKDLLNDIMYRAHPRAGDWRGWWGSNP